jgi:ribosomal protein S6--L-glutamate ligase
VAAMQRTAAEGEFRSNLHRGGTAETLHLTQTLKAFAIRAAQLHGLSVGGIDILLSNRGPLFIEANSSPGLEGIERTTKVDIAGSIIHYLEKEARRKKKQPQYKQRKNSYPKEKRKS